MSYATAYFNLRGQVTQWPSWGGGEKNTLGERVPDKQPKRKNSLQFMFLEKLGSVMHNTFTKFQRFSQLRLKASYVLISSLAILQLPTRAIYEMGYKNNFWEIRCLSIEQHGGNLAFRMMTSGPGLEWSEWQPLCLSYQLPSSVNPAQ